MSELPKDTSDTETDIGQDTSGETESAESNNAPGKNPAGNTGTAVNTTGQVRPPEDKPVQQPRQKNAGSLKTRDQDEANQHVSGASRPVRGFSRGNRMMLVRYGKMGNVGMFHHSGKDIPPGKTHVVVKTERGIEIGEIIAPFCHQRGNCTLNQNKVNNYYSQSGPNYPLSRQGTVVRIASDIDLKDWHHLNQGVTQELAVCRKLIEKLKLPMHLVDAEHLFGGERIIFYFMADGRVDFRELVKELAHQYQTRIEMRQIGARDEARLIADYEICGRECCCKNFLKVLQPVNMRMAKLQKATLDPAKISGRCGRLKCCLRYEDEVYNVLSRQLPRKGSGVLTEFGAGTVIDTHMLTQLVKIRLEESGRIIAVNVEEILEKNYKLPPKGKGAYPAEERKTEGDNSTKTPPDKNLQGKGPTEKATDTGKDEQEQQTTSQIGRTGGAPGNGSAVQQQEQGKSDGTTKSGKKRRRNRRKKKKTAGNRHTASPKGNNPPPKKN